MKFHIDLVYVGCPWQQGVRIVVVGFGCWVWSGACAWGGKNLV